MLSLTLQFSLLSAHEFDFLSPPEPEPAVTIPPRTGTWLVEPATIRLPATGSRSDRPAAKEVEDERLKAWLAEPPVGAWTTVLLSLIEKRQTSVPEASRAMALLHVGLNDALEISSAAAVSDHAVMAGAASPILQTLFPDDRRDLKKLEDEALRAPLAAGRATKAEIRHGRDIGREVARAVLEAAPAGPPADAAPSSTTNASPCAWVPTPPAFLDPVEPAWGRSATWFLPRADLYRPEAPPACDSAAFRREIDEARIAREKAGARKLSPALFFNDGRGTATPLGHWLKIALQIMEDRSVSNREAARVLSTLSVAGADAVIATWDAKYHYRRVRPVSVIRKTHPDWAPLAETPASPSYPSDRAVVGWAAAEVLAGFFPDQSAEFRHNADRAGLSRITGGWNTPFDVQKGQALGQAIGWNALAAGGTKGIINRPPLGLRK